MSAKGGGVTLPGFMDQVQKVDEEVNGEIVEVMDTKKVYPESGKMLGRVKVRIKGYNDKIPVKDLPWCTQLVPLNTGTGKGVSLCIPAKGTKVKVKKVGNDDYTWQAVSQVMTTKHSSLGWLQADYPNTWGMQDKTGSGYRINMKKKSAYFLHVSKTDAKITSSGATKVNIRDWFNVYIEDYAKWQIDGYLNTTINLNETRNVLLGRKTNISLDDMYNIGTFRNTFIGTNEILNIGISRTTNIGINELLNVGLSRITNVGINEMLNVGLSRTTNIADNDTLNISVSRDTNIADSDTLNVGGSQTTTITGKETHNVVSSRATIIGEDETLTVNGQLTITCIGGVLTIVSAGMLNLAAGGVMNLTAGKAINILAPTVNIP